MVPLSHWILLLLGVENLQLAMRFNHVNKLERTQVLTDLQILASEKEVSRVDLESALFAILFSHQVLNPLRSDNLKLGCSKTSLTSLLIELSDFLARPFSLS